jgi:hypothetical protein
MGAAVSTEATESVENAPAEPEGAAGGEPQQPQVGPNGFPLNVKPEEMTAEQAAAYWRHEARRQQDFNKANSKKLKELEPKAQQYDALAEASRSEAERAADQARADGEKAGRAAALAEARETFGAEVVDAKLSAAAERKGMTVDQLKTIAGDPNRFLGDEGVNNDAIADFLAALPDKVDAPAVETPRAPVRDIGGGQRTGAKPDAVASGQAGFASRHTKPSA